jgi:succinate-semialdehyde dehydrogenase/glutarate-semialdehyde dehydrogenase
MYPDTLLHIAGEWRPSSTQATIPVVNPATEEPIGTVAHSGRRDLEEAVRAAKSGFAQWRRTSALERAQVMKRASALLREREASIAEILTMEQGKPLHEALNEVRAAAETNDWFAEEAQRTYGRVIPSRTGGVHQFTLREPVGPVAAFTPGISRSSRLPASCRRHWRQDARSS